MAIDEGLFGAVKIGKAGVVVIICQLGGRVRSVKPLGRFAVVGVVGVENGNLGVHFEEGLLVFEIFTRSHVAEAGGDEVGHSGDSDGETIKNVVAQALGGNGDDSVFGTGLEGIA